MKLRVRLDHADFRALVRGKVVSKQPLNTEDDNCIVEIILADIGYGVMEQAIYDGAASKGLECYRCRVAIDDCSCLCGPTLPGQPD